jgi:hypothetical protein
MKRSRLSRFGVCLLVSGIGVWSCSDPVNDSVGRACRIIVGCGAPSTVGDCIDLLGNETPDCTYCIESSTCADYSSCQRDPSGCRIPPSLLLE